MRTFPQIFSSLSQTQKTTIRGFLPFLERCIECRIMYDIKSINKHRSLSSSFIYIFTHSVMGSSGIVRGRRDHILRFGTVLIFHLFLSLFRFLLTKEQWRYISDKATKISGLDQRKVDVSQTRVKMLLRISQKNNCVTEIILERITRSAAR